MPTYEYACTSCAHEWEFEQSIREDPLKECPACQKETARRQISRGVGFILKGGGWYADSYSSPGNKPPTEKSDNGDKKPAAGDKPAGGDSGAKPDTASSSSSTSSTSPAPSPPAAA
jgi:putative FmdB family regulatory protein